MATKGSRHVPLSVVVKYLANRTPGAFYVEGHPHAKILIKPDAGALALRVPANGRNPDIVPFRNVRLETLLDGADAVFELTVFLADNSVEEAYGWLCAVLDRIQINGQLPADSIEQSLSSLAGILARRRGLSDHEQLGLCGELIILLGLASGEDAANAVNCWLGPAGEQHDFMTNRGDLEVKTTLRERREHWISGQSQLVATGGRALHLVSIQLTTASAMQGLSLPDLVDLARNRLSGASGDLETKLDAVGFSSDDASLYTRRYLIRGEPVFYPVNNAFPALTHARLDASVPDAVRISEVQYLLDVTGLPEAPAFFTLTDIHELSTMR
jgi:hypothetical protein